MFFNPINFNLTKINKVGKNDSDFKGKKNEAHITHCAWENYLNVEAALILLVILIIRVIYSLK